MGANYTAFNTTRSKESIKRAGLISLYNKKNEEAKGKLKGYFIFALLNYNLEHRFYENTLFVALGGGVNLGW